jgi:hypothetical protein
MCLADKSKLDITDVGESTIVLMGFDMNESVFHALTIGLSHFKLSNVLRSWAGFCPEKSVDEYGEGLHEM